MILFWLLVILLAAGIAAWALEGRSTLWPRLVSLGALGVDLVLALWLWFAEGLRVSVSGPWISELDWEWIPRFGIGFHLGLDGMSLLLIVLTFSLGIASVIASWTEIEDRVGFFHFNLLWTIAGVTGVFLALDLFLFYFFWEMMLVPMYLLIGIWGHENRIYAAIKFFLFTQASGLLMLVAIVALAVAHHRVTGVLSFDYLDLAGTPLSHSTAWWVMLGFFAAFAVKLPAVPFHTWLPDAHTEAPTAGSVILAGLLLKTGAYGLLRFVLPLFPEAALEFAPIAMTLAVVSILYGAIMAFAQSDLKRLVAYSSVSHLGFVLLAVFAWNDLALQGSLMQMICHGLSTGALFILIGALQQRAHTRDMARLGGLWSVAPRMGALGMFFAMASLGLPGLGNFVAEFLSLLGAYATSRPLAILAALGLVAATLYSLRIIQQTFHGPNRENWSFADLSIRELAILGVLGIFLIWLGLYPRSVIDTARPVLEDIQRPPISTIVLGKEIRWPFRI